MARREQMVKMVTSRLGTETEVEGAAATIETTIVDVVVVVEASTKENLGEMASM